MALAIQTVIYLSNIIRRKRAEIRQTHSCVDFSSLKSHEQNKTETIPDQKPVLFTVRSSSFEESTSFERLDSYEHPTPSSFPGSPVKRASVSSRIPRAKPTTARQHIEDIRKSISNSNRNSESRPECKTRDAVTHRSRVEQFDAVGVAYQNVYGDKNNQVSDLKPPSVTLRSRPSSAKEVYSTRRLSLATAKPPPSASWSVPPSPHHDVVNAFAPGVKKRMPLSKCISVDERRPRTNSISSSSEQNPTAVARRPSVTENKKALYRASYPNRNSNYFTSATDTVTAKPRYPRKLSNQSEQQEKQVSDKCSKPVAPVRKSSVVRKRLPSSSSATSMNTQQKESLEKAKDTVDRIGKIANLNQNIPAIRTEDVDDSNTDTLDSSDEGNIRIVTKTNKTENIKIHHGKTVDKSVETSTTVSVKIDNEKKKATSSNQSHGLGRALLTKVKQLAEEIETLAMSTTPDDKEQADVASRRSFPHAASVPVLNSDVTDDIRTRSSNLRPIDFHRPDWDRDSFSETEYLSLDTRSERNGNLASPDTDTDCFF